MTIRIAFYDPRNTPKRPHAGDEFGARAKDFAGVSAYACFSGYDVTSALFHRLRAPIEQVGFFCHGFPNRLSVWSPTMSAAANARQLADHLRRELVPGGAVGLYACTTDTGTPGVDQFAELLSVALPGVTVFAHTTSGHTTDNPFCILLRDGKRIKEHPPNPKQDKAWCAYVKARWQDMLTEKGWP